MKNIPGTVPNPPGWHTRPVYRMSKAKGKDFVQVLMYLARELGLYPVGPRATKREETRSEWTLEKVTGKSENR